MKIKTITALTLIVLVLSACQASQTVEPTQTSNDDAFKLFLVADPQMAGADIQNYDIGELPLAEEPILTTQDLDSYLWEIHAINLTEEAYMKIIALFSGGLPQSGVPFVILSNNERIYAGAFWSFASSLPFDGVVIVQPMDPSGQPLFVALGYPSPDFFTGEDPRSNPQLKQALDNAGLLIE